MTEIGVSIAAYEARLAASLAGELVQADLAHKHKQMRKSAFKFLRATCWRYAETAPLLLPKLAEAPRALSLGDAHVENFGLWRDGEERLVWGANDFDEAAVIPYPFDLVRLAASAVLADKDGPAARTIADAILEGYRAGLERPRPFILEERDFWLRRLFTATKTRRMDFWRELREAKEASPPMRFAEALQASLPEPGIAFTVRVRRAGFGSLGRARYVADAVWRSGPVAREARALVPSCWAPAHSNAIGHDLLRAARGPFRSPDRWLDMKAGVVVRRLAPNSRKLEIGDIGKLEGTLLSAMGHEIANVHAGHGDRIAVGAHLAAQRKSWLARAAEAVAEATRADWKAFKKG